MKNLLLLLLLLLLPNLAGAAVAAPASHRETTTSTSALPNGRADTKHGFLKRFSEGVILRQVKKIRIRFNDSDEKWCSISGLAMGLLSIGGLLPSILGFTGLGALGVYLSIPLSLGGLALSIIGLNKARSWNRPSRWAKGISLAGIVLNGLVVVFWLGFALLLLK